MTVEAIALLKIPYQSLCEALEIEPASSAKEALAAASTLVPLGENGTACVLDMAFNSEPDDLSLAIFGLVGESLAQHDDERGMLIVPDKGFGEREHTSYEVAVEFFGEAGEWIAKPDHAAVQRMMAANVQSMIGGEGFAGMAQMLQSELAANPNMLANLGGADGGGLMEMAQQMLAQMSPEQQAQLEQMAKAMFGNLDPSALTGGSGPQRPVADDDEEDDEFGGPDGPNRN